MTALKKAAREIRKGRIVAYPTESFYALGVDATNARAIGQVFWLKGRTERKPIALVAGDFQQVKKYFYMTEAEENLGKKYWPGSLTLLLEPKRITTPASGHPSYTRRGMIAGWALVPSSPGLSSRGRRGARIGVRVPVHAQARKFALACRVPLTATSANVSGKSPTKSRNAVVKIFPDLLVLDGKCGKYRRPSTIVQVHDGKIMVLRQGAITIS